MFNFGQIVVTRILKFIRDMHSEDTQVSWMRCCGTVVILTILGVFVAHNVSAIHKGLPYQDFGFESVGIITAVLGAKVWQRKNENAGSDPSSGDTVVQDSPPTLPVKKDAPSKSEETKTSQGHSNAVDEKSPADEQEIDTSAVKSDSEKNPK